MKKDTDDPWAYFVLLTHLNKPRFIKVINGQSYFVSEYEGKITSKLWANGELKVAVRNHLCKIIITFNDDYDSPWIVENELTKWEIGDNSDGDKNPPKLFCVPSCNLALWGGNIKVGFNFGPIVYESRYILALPTLSKEELSQTDEDGNNQIDWLIRLLFPNRHKLCLVSEMLVWIKRPHPHGLVNLEGLGPLLE